MAIIGIPILFRGRKKGGASVIYLISCGIFAGDQVCVCVVIASCMATNGVETEMNGHPPG